jgi:1-acyl-sn-glycerol-3-phosphate acyltransferase
MVAEHREPSARGARAAVPRADRPAHPPRPGVAAPPAGRLLYPVARTVLSVLFRTLYRPVVEGLDNIPATGPVILASNHLSFVDSVVIPLAVPRRVTFLAKAEYFRGRGVRGRLSRLFFTTIGAVPVPRGTHRAATASLDTAVEILAAGGAFGIYPEGTRSRDGRLYRGRTGVGYLALVTGAPVVPVALAGTDRVQPVGARLPRVHRVAVRFGEPLRFAHRHGTPGPTAAASARARREVTDEVMRAIGALSGQDQADSYNTHGAAA